MPHPYQRYTQIVGPDTRLLKPCLISLGEDYNGQARHTLADSHEGAVRARCGSSRACKKTNPNTHTGKANVANNGHSQPSSAHARETST